MSINDSSTRSIQLVAGSPTCQFTAPSTYTLRLPTTGYSSQTDEICLKSLVIYNSVFNVTAAKGNNSLSYVWPDGGGTYSVILPDGSWSFANIITYFQTVMSTNGHSLLDAFGNSVYYIQIIVNPTLYCLSLVCTPLPTSLPAGYSNPSGINFATAGGLTPQIIINAPFAKLTGFAQGMLPAAPQLSVYQVNGTTPSITDVTSYNLICNLVTSDGFTIIPGFLDTYIVPNGTLVGALITKEVFSPNWVPIQENCVFQTITITITDQLFRPVILQDSTGTVITLNIRKRINKI